MLKTKEVRVFMDELICDNCGAKMEFSGIVLTSAPPMFEHICPKCGKRVNPREKYPLIRYEPSQPNTEDRS